MKKIETQIFMRATGELREETEEELKKEDPNQEEAEAILKDNISGE